MALDMDEYALPVVATVLYFFMWNSFLMQQLMMRGSANERAYQMGRPFHRFDYSFAEWEMADRTLMNTQEQMVGFLLPMWLYAVFCNAHAAGVLGIIYVVFRFLYPIFWSMKGRFSLLVELSTQPNYAVQYWFLVSLLWRALSGEVLTPPSPWLWPVYVILAQLFVFVVSWGAMGFLLGTINKQCFMQEFDD
eukprot:TRINITY_DN101997_c0_g1_i1.p1 TRINITY_DN101997_c0_g1~~TRINITY_DN101997_c0_g1_i1.p1  ORF type:complete len:192 (+),score=32.19 TRINITY_DN101997_c0_g1_i1:69-644(+)